MNKHKKILFAVPMVALMALSSVAYAKDISDSASNKTQPSVSIGINGDFQVAGVKVTSIATSTQELGVSLYGFNRTVNISGAQILIGNKKSSITDIKTGDYLMARGHFDTTTHQITVKWIYDVTQAPGRKHIPHTPHQPHNPHNERGNKND